MLVTLNEILKTAEERHCAVGAINTPNLECIIAALTAAERLNTPVILSHAQLHEEAAPLTVIGPIMVMMAKEAKIPACVHLDHCEDLEYLQTALGIGFTGVMYDGSALSYEENVANSREAVRMAHAVGASVEGELGTLPSREGGSGVAAGPVYTDPDLAVEFCKATGIDALAPSFGTAHGIYKSKPVLDLNRVEVIARETGLPLVMHGGSGVSEEDYRAAIRSGIRKINYYSYMSKAAVEAVRAMLNTQDVTFYHDAALTAQHAMQKDVERALHIFSMEQ